MIEKTRCKSCKTIYEISWNDGQHESWRDEFDYDDDQDDSCDTDEEVDDPAYCPFCGVHIDYDE